MLIDFTIEEYEYDVKGVDRAMRLLERRRKEIAKEKKKRRV